MEASRSARRRGALGASRSAWRARRRACGQEVAATASLAVLVQGAANAVMRSVTELVLPQFVNLLERDYSRWANGTRELNVSVGELVRVSEYSP